MHKFSTFIAGLEQFYFNFHSAFVFKLILFYILFHFQFDFHCQFNFIRNKFQQWENAFLDPTTQPPTVNYFDDISPHRFLLVFDGRAYTKRILVVNDSIMQPINEIKIA